MTVLSATRDLQSSFSLSSSHDAEGAVAGKKRARKEKAPKDPDAPKKPITSYMFYQDAKRKEMAAAHPNLAYKEVLRLMGQQWRELSEEEKAVSS